MAQIIDEYAQRQSSIIDIITDSRRDHINHDLFTPTQIAKQIELIKRHIGPDYHVPNEYEIYSLGKISVFRIANQYIFKISIPLMKMRKFKLYAITNIPTIVNGRFLWVDNTRKFLLTSVDRQIYQFMDDKNDCVQYRDKTTLICYKPTQWFTAGKSSCVWNIFNHLSHNNCELREKEPEKFLTSVDGNKYVFVLNSPLKFTVFCADSIMHDSLVGEGLLTLNQQCSLDTEHIRLMTRSELGDNSSEIVIPNLDLRGWKLPEKSEDFELRIENITEQNDFTKLKAILNDTKENSVLIKRENVEVHDIHH